MKVTLRVAAYQAKHFATTLRRAFASSRGFFPMFPTARPAGPASQCSLHRPFRWQLIVVVLVVFANILAWQLVRVILRLPNFVVLDQVFVCDFVL